MSPLTASMAIVFFFGFAAAQITAPPCSPTWKWVCILSFPQWVLWHLLDLMDFFIQSFNSLGQDPCLMTAYMYSTCSGGCESFPCYILSCIDEPYRLISFSAYEIDPLPAGYHYSGPWKGIDDRNLCECSTVGYSLISACVGCQGDKWGTYDPRRFSHLNSRNLCICL